jgi:hypothetical protein
MKNSDYELVREKLHILREQKKTLIRYIQDTRICGCLECVDELEEYLAKFKEV